MLAENLVNRILNIKIIKNGKKGNVYFNIISKITLDSPTMNNIRPLPNSPYVKVASNYLSFFLEVRFGRCTAKLDSAGKRARKKYPFSSIKIQPNCRHAWREYIRIVLSLQMKFMKPTYVPEPAGHSASLAMQTFRRANKRENSGKGRRGG